MKASLVKDINPDGSSLPSGLVENEGILYFVAELDATQQGLWKTDGSERGTILIRTFDSINNLIIAGGLVYFIAETENQFEIWSTDGTTNGTKKINSLNPGNSDFSAYNPGKL